MHDLTLLRRRDVSARTGEPRSTLYDRIASGEMVPPVRLGAQSSAWPKYEVDTIVAARIAGRSRDEIRALVRQLVADRATLPDRLAR